MTTLKSGIISNTVWRSVQIASSLLLNVLLARMLGPAESGSFLYLVTVWSLYIQVGGFSLESAIGFFASSHRFSTRSLAKLSIAWSLLVSIACIVVYAVTNTLNPLNGPENWYVFAFILGNLLSSYFTALYSSQLNFRLPNIVGSMVNLVLSMLILGYTAYSGDRTQWIERFFLLSFLVKAAWIVIYYYSRESDRTVGDASLTRKQLPVIFRYSLLAWIANLLSFLVYRVDYYFVKQYCSQEELGNYIQVGRISQVFFMFPAIIATVVFPIAASEQGDRIAERLAGIGRTVMYSLLLACFLLAATGYWLFPTVFGAGFTGMYLPYLLLTPGIIALATIYPYTAYFAGSDRIAVNIKGTLLALAVIIAGDLLLVPTLGIPAAAGVSSAGYITYQFYILQQFRREQSVSFGHLFYFQVSDFRRVARSIHQLTQRNEIQ